MSILLDSLPAFYRTRVSELMQREIPDETKATCDDCAMCDTERAVPAVDGISRLFRTDVKCCTYHPKLPNYLVGSLLTDGSAEMAEGQRRVRDKITQRIGLSPLWLRPSAKYRLLYDQARNAFGRSEALRCPYFATETGGCTIWRHREAVCSTYFCRYEKGKDGHLMWMQVKAYLALLEAQLTRYAVHVIMPSFIIEGRDGGDTSVLSAQDLDDLPLDTAAHARMWGEWAGREEEFYVRCFEVVSALDAAGVEKLLGLDGTLSLAVLGHRQQLATSEAIPEKLTWNTNAAVRWLPDGSVALGSYSDLDALALDGEAYAMLIAFDGTKSTSEVRAQLRRDKQSDLSDSVLMALYRHRILF